MVFVDDFVKVSLTLSSNVDGALRQRLDDAQDESVCRVRFSFDSDPEVVIAEGNLTHRDVQIWASCLGISK